MDSQREHLQQQPCLDAAVFAVFASLNFPDEAFGDFLDQLHGRAPLGVQASILTFKIDERSFDWDLVYAPR